MFDFSSIPFFDDHSHRIDVSNREINPIDMAIAFVHGWGPMNPSVPDVNSCTPEYEFHVMNMGVVKVVINLMANYFGCEATIEAVVRERNKRTAVDGYGYAKSLYEDAKIIGEMIDDDAPLNDPALNCFPTKIYRLFQMDPFFRKLLAECDSFDELKTSFDSGLRARLAEGYIGVKSHLLELRAQPIRVIEDAEAAACFKKAKDGDKNAFEDVYLAIFEYVLCMTQELNFTVHVHTGCTGNPNDLQTCTDPYAMVPLMRDQRYFAARIVFLHGNPPDFGHIAWVCHAYPNVWMDISWSLPWLAMNMESILEEVLSMAPHSKIMFGTGQHTHAEVSWAASKVAKSTLENVLEHQVKRGLLSKQQAAETAELLLYKNAARLYGFEE